MPRRLYAHLKKAYLRRPQALLFLAISYALWASVTLRWIMEFMEQEHPLTPLIGGLLLLFGLPMGLEPLLTAESHIRGHLYLLVQLGLIVAALLLWFELDFFAILLLPLTGQATFLFPRRTASIWVAILILANVLGQMHQFGWPGGALSIIGLILIVDAMYFEAFIASSVAVRAPDLFQGYPAGGGWEGFLAGVLASGTLFGVGFLLLAIGMLRAGVMSRWAILLAVAGGVPFAVNFLLPRPVALLAVAVFGVGLLGLGYGLRKSVRQPAAQQP